MGFGWICIVDIQYFVGSGPTWVPISEVDVDEPGSVSEFAGLLGFWDDIDSGELDGKHEFFISIGVGPFDVGRQSGWRGDVSRGLYRDRLCPSLQTVDAVWPFHQEVKQVAIKVIGYLGSFDLAPLDSELVVGRLGRWIGHRQRGQFFVLPGDHGNFIIHFPTFERRLEGSSVFENLAVRSS